MVILNILSYNSIQYLSLSIIEINQWTHTTSHNKSLGGFEKTFVRRRTFVTFYIEFEEI